VNKVESTIDSADSKEDLAVVCKVKAAAGLAELNCKRYKPAAKYFLSTSFENFSFSDVSEKAFSIGMLIFRKIIKKNANNFYLRKVFCKN